MDAIIPQPEQIQYQAPVPEHKHFLNKKFIATFVILILLGSGAYASLWYWQNQQVAQEVAPTFTPRADATADWKTYTNSTMGIQFMYPASWQAQDNSIDSINRPMSVDSVTQGDVLKNGKIYTSFMQEFQLPDKKIVFLSHTDLNLDNKPLSQQLDFIKCKEPNTQCQNLKSQYGVDYTRAISGDADHGYILGSTVANGKYILGLSIQPYKDRLDEITDPSSEDKTSYSNFDTLLSTLKFPGSAIDMHCGGNIQNAPTCPTGYTCKLNVSLPDTGGTCQKN